MSNNMIAKKKVDKFVWNLACGRRERFTASYISKNINVDIDFVKKRLIELRDDDKLFVNFELICDSPECEFRTIRTYSKIDDVPIGDTIKCTNCGKESEVAEKSVLVTFSPNTNYYDDEMCDRILHS